MFILSHNSLTERLPWCGARDTAGHWLGILQSGMPVMGGLGETEFSAVWYTLCRECSVCVCVRACCWVKQSGCHFLTNSHSLNYYFRNKSFLF